MRVSVAYLIVAEGKDIPQGTPEAERLTAPRVLGTVCVIVRRRLCLCHILVFAIGERFDLPGFIMDFTSLMPNKSPEPTPVGAGSSASRSTVSGPAWLSFFR